MDMSCVQAGRFLTLLCVLGGTLANATHAAETPATSKEYTFELQTLNLGERVRRKQVQFNVDNGMTEEELDAVNHELDQLHATPVDAAGNRDLSLGNGTRVRIGGFLTEGYLEDSVEGVHRLPMHFTVEGEFSTAEAALVLRLAAVGNLFVGSSADPDRVATTARVDDKRFYKLHKQVAITADETALAEWVRQNIPTAVP